MKGAAYGRSFLFSLALHRAAHYAQGACNGGEYGDEEFEDFFPVDSHRVESLGVRVNG